MDLTRVNRLKTNHLRDFNMKRDLYRHKYADIFKDFPDLSHYASPCDRTADYLTRFAAEFPAVIQDDELIAGIDWHWNGNHSVCNMGHFAADYTALLTNGTTAIINKTEGAFKKAMTAFSSYINTYAVKAGELGFTRIASDCSHIANLPPATFQQALQLVWFTHIFLHTEANSAAVSFGRFDQYLYPFLKSDMDAGRLTAEEALDLIMSFYIKTSEGDESQNLIVGGNENILSFLCIKAQRMIKMRQPTLSVRINKNTSDDFWNASLALSAEGIGMPSYFCDETVIKALMNLGIPHQRAEDYAVVGCYETCPQGDTHALTVAYGYNLTDILLDYMRLHSAPESYAEYYSGFCKYYHDYYIRELLPAFQKHRSQIARKWGSPFLACCMKGCIENNLAPEQYGAVYSFYSINILGIGTLVDSLYCIEKLIFSDKRYTYSQLLDAMDNNFADEEMYRSFRNLEGKYGTNSDRTNCLAAELSEMIGRISLDHPLDHNVKVSPALFRWLADVYTGNYPATPDGRRKNERLSYGIAPTEISKNKCLTSILGSSANIKTDLFPDGCPLTVSLSAAELDYLKNIISVYFNMGGFHLNINVTDYKKLEAAQNKPEQYEDLLIKISGFSAKFVTLDKQLQDALIIRTKNGR